MFAQSRGARARRLRDARRRKKERRAELVKGGDFHAGERVLHGRAERAAMQRKSAARERARIRVAGQRGHQRADRRGRRVQIHQAVAVGVGVGVDAGAVGGGEEAGDQFGVAELAVAVFVAEILAQQGERAADHRRGRGSAGETAVAVFAAGSRRRARIRGSQAAPRRGQAKTLGDAAAVGETGNLAVLIHRDHRQHMALQFGEIRAESGQQFHRGRFHARAVRVVSALRVSGGPDDYEFVGVVHIALREHRRGVLKALAHFVLVVAVYQAGRAETEIDDAGAGVLRVLNVQKFHPFPVDRFGLHGNVVGPVGAARAAEGDLVNAQLGVVGDAMHVDIQPEDLDGRAVARAGDDGGDRGAVARVYVVVILRGGDSDFLVGARAVGGYRGEFAVAGEDAVVGYRDYFAGAARAARVGRRGFDQFQAPVDAAAEELPERRVFHRVFKGHLLHREVGIVVSHRQFRGERKFGARRKRLGKRELRRRLRWRRRRCRGRRRRNAHCGRDRRSAAVAPAEQRERAGRPWHFPRRFLRRHFARHWCFL